MNRLPNIDEDSYEFDELQGMDREKIVDVKIGDIVKLVFRIMLVHEDGKEEWNVERMWVIVDGFENDLILGRLDNSPYCTDDMKRGDKVVFMLKHVLMIKGKSNLKTLK